MKSRTMRAALAAAMMAVAGCTHAAGPVPQRNLEAELLPLIEATAAAWNRADLDGHVSAYADSAEFMAPGPLVGRDRIKASLLRSFWRDGRPVQQLRYEQIQVRPLGPNFALMTGHCVLSGGGRPDYTCWFSLVWQRTPAGWKIIHDHSS